MEMLNEFARLLVEVGVNIQKGQRLVITSPVDCAAFARLCTSAAYRAGCKEVVMNWVDDYVTRETYLFADEDVFDNPIPYRAALYNDFALDGAAFLTISTSDPESLKNVPPDRIRRASISSSKAVDTYWNRIMSNVNQWCLTSIPTAGWARKVYPKLTPAEAMAKLWESVFQAMRIKQTRNSVDMWRIHLERIEHRKTVLTKQAYQTLHFNNALGTDLTLELPENHYWDGGASKSTEGVVFCANMPTEEVYTAPKRARVNGVVYSTRVLALHGNIIDKFRVRFEEGRAVELDGGEGIEILRNALDTDEGARYLGEVALVPFSSPISQMGVDFYNTLFDESSSCHLAFGKAYPSIVGEQDMTPEQLAAHGLNDSRVHIDFMIGTEDMQVTGVRSGGQETAIFENGSFTF